MRVVWLWWWLIQFKRVYKRERVYESVCVLRYTGLYVSYERVPVYVYDT